MTPFDAFRKAPSPETVMALLRAHQDAVYTVCFQVLKHAQDAEDAAQETLLKMASGAKGLRDPRAFKSWLYRVAFRTAVDHHRRRDSRRRTEEGRSAMVGRWLPDDALAALHEAMADLPDGDRLLLAEHYFEKTPLEDLGRREKVSAVAVWKRIEKAKERLKRGLAGAGFAVGGAEMSHALESVTPVSAPPGLVGSAIASKAALLAAGGIAMGTKTLIPMFALLALLFLSIGGAGGYLIGAKRSAPVGLAPTTEAQVLDVHPAEPASSTVEQPGSRSPESTVTAEPPKKKLVASLEKYKSLKDRHNAKWKAWSAAHPNQGIDPRELSKDSWTLTKELEGIREEIFEDPQTFLDFLSRPENESYVWNLFDVTLTRRPAEGFIRQQECSELPFPLTEGLLGLLRTGSPAVRDQILSFMRNVTGQPDDFKRQYLEMLGDPNPHIVKAAAEALPGTSPLSPEEFSRLATVVESSPVREVSQVVISSMWRIQTPESRDWRLSALETGRLPDMDAALASSLMTLPRDGLGEALEDRFVRALAAALNRTSDEATYLQVLQTTRMLPLSKSKTHFELAAIQGPTPKVRDASARCLELINAGRADWKSIGTILNDAQAKN